MTFALPSSWAYLTLIIPMATTAQAGLRNCSSASSSFFLISCLLFLLLLLLLRFLHLHFLLLCKIFFAFFFSFLSISICRVQTNFSWSWTLIFRVSFLWVLAFCQDVNVMMWVFCTWVLLWSLDLSSACRHRDRRFLWRVDEHEILWRQTSSLLTAMLR